MRILRRLIARYDRGLRQTVLDVLRWLEATWEWVKCGCRFTSECEAIERHRICVGSSVVGIPKCDELSTDANGERFCGQCGCYIELAKGHERAFSKVYFPAESCPLGKWPVRS